MNNSITELLQWFCYSIVGCYPLILILLIGYLFLPSGRNWESINLLFAVNTLIVIVAIPSLIGIGIHLYETYYSQTVYEWFSFSGPFDEKFYYAAIICTHIVALLFLFRMLRRSLLFSLFFLLLQNWESVYFLFLKWFPRSSSWSVYFSFDLSERIINIIVFMVSVSLVYFILHLRNKLPYSSTILRTIRSNTDVQ